MPTESIPFSDSIARVIFELLVGWDEKVIKPGRWRPADGSLFAYDTAVGVDSKIAPVVAQRPHVAGCMLIGSMSQQARSFGALFAESKQYDLTFGHLPLLRAIFEAAGWLRWVMMGERLLDDSDRTPAAARRRFARALLLNVANAKQLYLQGEQSSDADLQHSALDALGELAAEATQYFNATPPPPDKRIKSDWTVAGQKLRGPTFFGVLGWNLTWYGEETNGHPYGWLCAVTHQNLYPVGSALKAEADDYAAIRPDVGEIAISGMIAAMTVFRMIDLMSALLALPEELFRIEHENLDALRKAVMATCGQPRN